MGVEITLFALPEKCAAVEQLLLEKGNGELLQNISFLIYQIRRGLPADNEIESWQDSEYLSANDVLILNGVYETIQQNPHLPFNYFYDGPRGHDHWVYLLELLADPANIHLPRTIAFGSQHTPDSATATQGALIGWSNVVQVQTISQFLNKVDEEEIRARFKGFPQDRSFYKRRSDERFTEFFSTIRELKRLYSKASNQRLVIVSILD